MMTTTMMIMMTIATMSIGIGERRELHVDRVKMINSASDAAAVDDDDDDDDDDNDDSYDDDTFVVNVVKTQNCVHGRDLITVLGIDIVAYKYRLSDNHM